MNERRGGGLRGRLLALAWVRDTGEPDFIPNPRSDLYYATSADGLDIYYRFILR